MSTLSRRRFLQATAAAAAAAGAHSIYRLLPSAGAAEGDSVGRLKVHPRIDDLRVAAVTDEHMTTARQVKSTWAAQEKLVNADAASRNIGKLACALVEQRDESEAWNSIFVKPPDKSWAETVVAIKTNMIAQQHTRSAVMAAVCRALTDVLGVAADNIHIYDACHGGDMARKTPFAGLPDGVRLEGRWGGSSVTVPVGAPYSGKRSQCVKPLTDGTVDILINIAMCKGHGAQFGGFTMTMKNHLGTFAPRPAHREGMDYLVAINRTPEILGPLDADTHKVAYPRQQLCLVDALWASRSGPGGLPTAQPNTLAMGVFGPAVDYLMATEFRAKRMGWPINEKALSGMLDGFSLAKDDFKGLTWVEA